MEWSPALRPEVQKVHGEDGGLLALRDGLFGHHVNLGPVARALAPRLDGSRPLGALLREAGAEAGVDAAVAGRSLRNLLLMNLVEGAGDEIVRRARALRAGTARLGPVTLPGSRFACQGSGACCHNYALGPLTPADLERLGALDLAGALPDVGPGPYTEERTLRDGTHGHFLRTRGGSCLFQLGDGRCGIHAAFGFDAKPRMCRIFPLQEVPTVFGLRIYDRGECTRFAKSARSGRTFDEDMDRVLQLLGEPAAIYHPLVLLDEGTPCDYGHFVLLQDALCALVRAGAPAGDALQTLLAVGRMVHAFVEELPRCPLAPGEPDRTVAAVLGRGATYLAPPGPPPADGLRKLAAVAGELLDAVLPTILHGERGPEEYLAIRDLEHFAGVVHSIEALACYREEGRRPDAFHERVLAVRTDDPEIDEAFRLALQGQLFGLRLLLDERPVPALLRLAFAFLITHLGAQRLAARDRVETVREEDFSASHSLALRVLHRNGVREVFLERQELCWDILASIPALLGVSGAAPGDHPG